jgi:hypothetical protein
MVSTSDNSSTDPLQFKPPMPISRYTLAMPAIAADLSIEARRFLPAAERWSCP